tara:strand:+ start:5800 stop:6324 length:525 start_codon:yes stop_codon:yes gene_type:complete
MNLYKLFITFILIQFLLGCGGPRTTASKIYNKAFSKTEEIECPKVRFIKGIDELYKKNDNDELVYKVDFNKLDGYCYIKQEEGNNSYYINLNVSFNISFEKENTEDNYKNFKYIIALLDVYERVVVSNKYLFNFYADKGLLNFSKNNEENIIIKINLEKIGNPNEAILLLGFIK